MDVRARRGQVGGPTREFGPGAVRASTALLNGSEERAREEARHTPEQIVRKLREADRLLAEGADRPEAVKALEVSEARGDCFAVGVFLGSSHPNRSEVAHE
jgi:hypothetical protein